MSAYVQGQYLTSVQFKISHRRGWKIISYYCRTIPPRRGERERERAKPQQGEDLKHDSGGQKQIHLFGQARYQPKQPFSVDISNCL